MQREMKWLMNKKTEDEREEESDCLACRDRLGRKRRDGQQQTRRATEFLASFLSSSGTRVRLEFESYTSLRRYRERVNEPQPLDTEQIA